MLQIRFSNRFERLLKALLAAMAASPESAFVGEEIIVPSAAVRRRIELAVADRFGICANVRFSFLAQWLWRQIGRDLGTDKHHPSVAFFEALQAMGAGPDPRRAVDDGTRVLPANHAAAVPRHPAPSGAVDRCPAVRGQSVP